VQLECVLLDPSGAARSTDGSVVTATFAQTTGPLAGGGETTLFTVLVHGFAYPVVAGVASDGLVVGVHQDDLEVLVGRVLGNPVAVQHTQTAQPLSGSALSDGLQVPHRLLLVNGTTALGLTIGTTLGDGTLPATTSHAHAVDDETLLVSVAHASGLVRTGGARCAMQPCELTILPGADTQQVPHHIALLFTVQLRHVSVGSHFDAPGYFS
jgi:hypothetical protein